MKAHKVMALVISLVATGGLPRAAEDAKEEAAKKEMKTLAGTWAAVSVESNGKKAPDEEIKEIRYVFDAKGKWQLKNKGETIGEGTYTIDPTAKPKTITYKITTSISKKDEGKTSVGIYELEGDNLKVCRTWPENLERPKEFSAGPDSKTILSDFKREKP
ncbi:MAG: TIGR03067 domain-containing protein [Gemmataceae bacterium]